jgi:putative spermidine/putrescine transport system permease protein
VLSAEADLAPADLAAQPVRVAPSGSRAMRLLPGVALRLVVALVYVFLLGPIVVVVATSFSPTHSMAFPPPGFSLRWYGEFLRSDNFTGAFRFSLVLGLCASAIATLIGFVTAYAARRLMLRRGGIVQSLAMLPLLIPHLLISISLLLALNFIPLPDFAALLAGHVLICTPFTVAGITASLDGVDAQLEAAAMTLGASRLTALVEVVVPLVAPGVLSALLFAFVVSFGDVYIALFLAGPGTTTLPIEIFSYVQWDSSPVIAAITTVQIMMIVVLGLVIERLVGLRRIMRI